MCEASGTGRITGGRDWYLKEFDDPKEAVKYGDECWSRVLMGWEQWRKTVTEEEALETWDHIAHSPNCSIAKARKMIGYNPHYTSLEAVRESMQWLIDNGQLRI